MPDLVDSPGESLPFLRNGWRVGCRVSEGGSRGGEGEETVVDMYNEKFK